MLSVGYGINRTCYTDQPPGSVDQCLMMNHFQKQYTFFLYRDLCCFSTNNTIDHNGKPIYFTSTICVCDKDKCNGDIPSYITTSAPGPVQPTAGNSIVAVTTTTTMSSGKKWLHLSQPLIAAALLVTKFMTSV